ncbi:hypothetical protein P280DRAFT_444537 [Massarina eburnea CBS 473.64]|uniref:Oxidoreductase-like domain-containing protein n=1 Tax=Massarina eburnea CBS 473.64 TaxID=1395130 RepID=A0A6A6SC20_9PLEO|nr:hypothetical protein P280DRAFT_444537 [Massarina eburnea CBS 473.64]
MTQLAHTARLLISRHGICAPCSRDGSVLHAQKKGLQNSDRIQRRFKGYIAPPGGQAHPIGGFYAQMLAKPSLNKQPPPPPEAPPREPVSLRKTEAEETRERADQVFGSREKSAKERRAQWEAATQNIAGVMVPPRPTEPDNCCMSGCVNCVWDMYRDEMEEWAAKTTEARANMEAQTNSLARSMDDDGGGSETNWLPTEGNVDLFEDIPVGIKEFMRTEKSLKQKHRSEQAPSAA